MGIYERDYIKTPTRGGVGRLPMWSVTTWLIIINILVFAADWLIKAQWAAVHQVSVRAVTEQVMGPLELNGYFSIERAFQHGQAWRLLTCQFLHAGFWHLAMNMLGLWIFGELVERRIGRRRYAFFYLLCGIAGPFMYTALWTLGYLTPIGFMPHTNTPLVGASAGIFGVMLAAAYLEPDRLIYVYFIEVPLKYFAWFMVAVAAYTVFAHGENAGGQAAHLGGALLGYILIRHDSALNLVVRRNTSQRVFTKDWSRDPNR
jgi:membrane associated rhomboid family serine protease